MSNISWETVSGLVGRQAVAIAVVLTTTFGGIGTGTALASSSHRQPARRVLAKVDDPADAVFNFGDDLDAVNYEIGFLPDQRDPERLGAACKAVFRDQPGFESAVQHADHAKDIGAALVADAEPIVELCADPMSADDDAEANAAQGFDDFHEQAFDFAAAVK
ncbi:MAG TPA: hypothetical protein VHD87_16685 [Acidimicrobiales bacterium]|nr:hypothetical protein [Acidimicrobiales bacterium]